MPLLIFAGLVICMLACHFIAKAKAYNPVAWGLSGAILGPIPLVILLLLPTRSHK